MDEYVEHPIQPFPYGLHNGRCEFETVRTISNLYSSYPRVWLHRL